MADSEELSSEESRQRCTFRYGGRLLIVCEDLIARNQAPARLGKFLSSVAGYVT
jgi:hypothetical protein